MAHEFDVNGSNRSVTADDQKPLLWVLREDLGLHGAKFGCGVGSCGACTVLVDGVAVRSCVVPVSQVAGKNVQTIEGMTDGLATSLKDAWVELRVPQCGYCQTGQIMAAYSLLKEKASVDDASINTAMTNICRCGTYGRIRSAIKKVASEEASK
jgi:isoquinoline 1-oxidoreductase subunit alpha